MNIWSKTNFPCICFFSLFFVLNSASSFAQSKTARELIKNEISKVPARFGVAWKHLEASDTGSINPHMKFPMQSVFKFPLALAILDQVDKRRMSLNQKIHISKEDYYDTWSPIMKKYPDADVDLSLKDVLMYNTTHSDNVACDILFRLLGGPPVVEKYIHGLGITGMAIQFSEKEMHAEWNIQFKNWCEPVGMLQLLEKFYIRKVLSKSSHQLLQTMMEETSTGPKRIKGLLPEGTVVAHRTGFSGRDANGVIAAVNDVGIITLPDGTHLLIVVYVSDSLETDENLELAIARIARSLYDFYSHK
jgi:beta-lactamase class A